MQFRSLPAVLLLALSVAACGDGARPGTAGVGDSYYPRLGNGGYQVEHYTLDIEVTDVSRSELSGLARIEAVTTQRLSRFNLDLIGLTVDAVHVDGRPARFERDGYELVITPAAALAADAPFTVEVRYHGVPERYLSMAAPEEDIGWITHDHGSYAISEPDGGATFFPVNDHPLDKATYTFRLTVPKPYQVAANGVLRETADHGDRTTYVFEARDPMTSYLATIAIERFELVSETGPNGLPLSSYFSTMLDPAYRVPFANVPRALALFNERFGPYPFEVYGSIMVNAPSRGPLETQTRPIYGNDEYYLEDPQWAELIVVHETAHQWFGNSVSVTDWSDLWINEGFATYAEWLWLEETEGSEARDAEIAYIYEAVATSPTAVPPGRLMADDLFDYASAYGRPALMLHALRLEIGDHAFFALLRAYPTRYAYGHADRAQLLALAEELSGRELRAFFDAWLYGQALPPIPPLGLAPETVDANSAQPRSENIRLLHRHGHRPPRY